MKILVTGATGFIGKNLVKSLFSKHNLCALIRKKSLKKDIDFLKKHNVKLIYGDIETLDFENIRCNVDVIIHLAAILGNETHRAEEYIKINVDGTKNVIKLANKIKSRKIIFISSVAASYKQFNIKDSNHIYGKSKFLAEAEIKNSGLNYTIIRPGLVYGPHNLSLLPLFKMVKFGFFICFNRNTTIQPLYVEDLIKLIKKSIQSTEKKSITVVGKKIKLLDFVKLISNEFRPNMQIIKIPKLFGKTYLTFFLPLLKLLKINPLLTWSRYSFFTNSTDYKSNIRTNTEEHENTIKKTVEWYQNKNYL